MKFKVRSAKQTDLKDISRLDKKYAEEFAEEAITKEEISDFYKRNPRLVWIAEARGKSIGFIIADKKQEEKVGYIEILFVCQKFRKKGVGSKMLEKVLKVYRKNGIEKIFLIVPAKNKEGQNFYKKHGFHINAFYLKKELEL